MAALSSSGQKSIVLYKNYSPSHYNPSCTHIKGHGGHKFSVRQVNQWIQSGEYNYVCRTDIRGYYANINKHKLINQLAEHVHNPIMLNLLAQFIFYTVEYGGTFHTPAKGISRGSPLSPLLTGFHLYEVDDHFSNQNNCKYLRFMDDFIILCKTRHHLRIAVRELNQHFNRFGFQQHPAKTFIGKISNGFDFLGYNFDASGLAGLAASTLAHHHEKLRQLYEQTQEKRKPQDALNLRVANYQRRWRRWTKAGLTPEDGTTQI